MEGISYCTGYRACRTDWRTVGIGLVSIARPLLPLPFCAVPCSLLLLMKSYRKPEQRVIQAGYSCINGGICYVFLDVVLVRDLGESH